MKKSSSEDKFEFPGDDMDIDWEDETSLDKSAEFDKSLKELPGSPFDRKEGGLR
ncbi:hypothetical protein [Endozoicomonas atrinae]|uniref:hypothetical protein n=1 Tax=Endozoicomonas atrinae TaxID=1333660 RepID=UPI001585FBA1|nr:hypothetical protein [Endozoicomonas atrinae]